LCVHHRSAPKGSSNPKQQQANGGHDDAKKRKAPGAGDEDFPRGGGSVLTPLEYREVKQQADAELFKV